jgi:Holin of 3TMs, for gene-transfer release
MSESASERKKEDWMNSKWRPMMGWMYMAVCTFDFMIAPILWSIVQAMAHGSVQTQWQPLTLQGAGLFHLAMGAVLGLSAYGRTQEKLAGANNGGIQTSFPTGSGTTYVPPTVTSMSTPAPQPTFTPPAPVATPAPAVSVVNVTENISSTPAPTSLPVDVSSKGHKMVPSFPQPEK